MKEQINISGSSATLYCWFQDMECIPRKGDVINFAKELNSPEINYRVVGVYNKNKIIEHESIEYKSDKTICKAGSATIIIDSNELSLIPRRQ